MWFFSWHWRNNLPVAQSVLEIKAEMEIAEEQSKLDKKKKQEYRLRQDVEVIKRAVDKHMMDAIKNSYEWRLQGKFTDMHPDIEVELPSDRYNEEYDNFFSEINDDPNTSRFLGTWQS